MKAKILDEWGTAPEKYRLVAQHNGQYLYSLTLEQTGLDDAMGQETWHKIDRVFVTSDESERDSPVVSTLIRRLAAVKGQG